MKKPSQGLNDIHYYEIEEVFFPVFYLADCPNVAPQGLSLGSNEDPHGFLRASLQRLENLP